MGRTMRAAIPTELLLRLMNATPEQYAAVAKILGVSAECGTRSAVKVGAGERVKGRKWAGGTDEEEDDDNIEHPTSNAEHRARVSEEVARSAFALLVRLDAERRWKSPSPLTVFRLYCVDGYSADQVARKCRCSKGTVMSRLRFIEAQTRTKPEEFRAMSGHLQQVDDELRNSGAREIYRRGLIDEE